MTENIKPILSILLPTFNRASILRLTLKHLLSEVERLKGLVEVVIGNNASTDETETVLTELTSEYTRVFCRETNIGSWRNIVALGNEARGEWVWVIGDDDFLVTNSLERIIGSLSYTPNIDLVCINHGWIEKNQLYESLEKSIEVCISNESQWRLSEDIELKNGLEIFDLPSPFPAGSFSTIFGFTIRRRVFNEQAARIGPGIVKYSFDESDFSLEDAFPHSIVALQTVAERPIKLIAHVCILQGVGGWEWGRYFYRTVILGHIWLFLRFESVVPKSAWQSLAKYAGIRLARILHDPESNYGLDQIDKSGITNLIRWQDFKNSFEFECERLGLRDEANKWLVKWGGRVGND